MTMSESRWRASSSTSVPVDRLRVEPALDARRELAGPVRVQGDVLDRLRLCRIAAIAGRPASVRPCDVLRRGAERHRRERPPLLEDPAGGAGDRRLRPRGGGRFVVVAYSA